MKNWQLPLQTNTYTFTFLRFFPKNFKIVNNFILIKEQNNAQRYFASLYQISTQNNDSYGKICMSPARNNQQFKT